MEQDTCNSAYALVSLQFRTRTKEAKLSRALDTSFSTYSSLEKLVYKHFPELDDSASSSGQPARSPINSPRTQQLNVKWKDADGNLIALETDKDVRAVDLAQTSHIELQIETSPRPASSTSNEQLRADASSWKRPPGLAITSPPRSQAGNFKTRPCRYFQEGYCRNGDACRFLHSPKDLDSDTWTSVTRYSPGYNSSPRLQRSASFGRREQTRGQKLSSSRSGFERRQLGRCTSLDVRTWLLQLLELSGGTSIERLSNDEGLEMLHDVVERADLNSETTDLLVRVLTKEDIRTSLLRQKTNRIYGDLLRSTFLLHLPKHIITYFGTASFEPEACLPYLLLIEEVQSRTGDGYKEVPLDVMNTIVSKLPADDEKTKLTAMVCRLMEQRDKQLRILAVAPISNCSGDTEYRQMPIMATKDELIGPQGVQDFPVNRIGFRYSNLRDYLFTHFTLLREDCIDPLRQGIAFYRHAKLSKDRLQNNSDLRIYSDVSVAGVRCGEEDIEFVFRFNVSEHQCTPDAWESSKKLRPGALLCISTDDFQTFFWAVVSSGFNRSLHLARGFVATQMVEEKVGGDDGGSGAAQQALWETNQKYVMVESTASYFEAYSHVLKTLQREEMDELPFTEHLVHLEPEVGTPSYLQHRDGEDCYDFSAAFPDVEAQLGRSSLGILQPEWPAGLADALELDESQLAALKQGLTKRLAIIQGPPGTGKTFLGIILVKLLLANLRRRPVLVRSPSGLGTIVSETPKSDIKGPIQVVCFTNHALDQFLEGLYKSGITNLIRIGGRSKSDLLKERSLHHLRKVMVNEGTLDYTHRRYFGEERAEKDLLETEIHECIDKIGKRYATFTALRGVATAKQSCSLFGEQDYRFNDRESTRLIEFWLTQDWCTDRSIPLYYGVMAPANKDDGREDASSDHEFEESHLLGRPNTRPNTRPNRGVMKRLPRDNANSGDLGWTPVTGNRKGKHRIQGSGSSLKAGPGAELGLVPGAGRFDTLNQLDEDENDFQNDSDVIAAESDSDGDSSTYNQEPEDDRSKTEEDERKPEEDEREPEEDEREPEDGEWELEDNQRQTDGHLDEEPGISLGISLQDFIHYPNVWHLNASQRRMLHKYWLDEIQVNYRRKLRTLTEDYEQVCRRATEVNNEIQVDILRRAHVVGMTTTAAAKYHDVVKSLNSEIVVIEEAAEILESHILACLSPHVKHLILIGDHMQLRPKATYRLSTQYNLDVSMFERLVQSGVEHVTLEEQRRMRLSISKLVKSLYPHSRDHVSVQERKNVSGVAQNVFFFDHEAEECSVKNEVGGKVNPAEARLVVELCMYLLNQGQYGPQDITILTMYAGQVLEIRRLLMDRCRTRHGLKPFQKNVEDGDEEDSENVNISRVSSVDDFQGEESDVIILSLVRSNQIETPDEIGMIGFVKTENRICVSLTRAREGLFIFGNATLLAAKSSLWETITENLRLDGALGPYLELCCEKHPNRKIRVSKVEDFKQVEDGGCDLPCEHQLDCGHACPRRCHNLSHDSVVCPKSCMRNFKECDHTCTRRCHGDTRCPPCPARVKRTLENCDHQQVMECHAKLQFKICMNACEKTLPCSHRCRNLCGRPCTASCEERVSKELSCGHSAMISCSQPVEQTLCTAPCGELLDDCGHLCQGTCGKCKGGTAHVECKRKCGRSLLCGHLCEANCSAPCPPCGKECRKRCNHSRCSKFCGEMCIPCRERCAWRCAHHRCEKFCFEICTRPRCNLPCPKRKKCGHPCIGLCGEPCPSKCRVCHAKTQEMFTQTDLGELEKSDRFIQLEDCRHIFEVSRLDTWMDAGNAAGRLDEPVAIKLKECPLCRTPIMKTKRYANEVKMTLTHVEQVKQKVLGYAYLNNGNHCLKGKDFFRALQFYSAAINHNPGLMEAHFQTGIVLNLMNRGDAMAFEHWCFILGRSSFRTRLENLIRRVEEDNLYNDSGGYYKSDGVKAMRLHLAQLPGRADDNLAIRVMLQLASTFANSLKVSNATELCNAVLEHDPENSVAKDIKDAALIGTVRTLELGKIVQAMAGDVGERGHWFQCPNGHYYTIGECGGATQKSRCMDCDATVGGDRHRLAAGNRPSDIDGSNPSSYQWRGNQEF